MGTTQTDDTENSHEDAGKKATPDTPASLPITVPPTAIDEVLDVWRPLKNERPPATPIERFFEAVGPTMKGLVAAGWPLKNLYEKAKPSIPGVSFTVFRRHAEPHLPTVKIAPKAERSASRKAENAAAREAVREAMDRVQDARQAPAETPVTVATRVATTVTASAPATVEKAVERPSVEGWRGDERKALGERPDYAGAKVEVSCLIDTLPSDARGFRRDGVRWVSPVIGGEYVTQAAEHLRQHGATDVQVVIVEPAPAPSEETAFKPV